MSPLIPILSIKRFFINFLILTFFYFILGILKAWLRSLTPWAIGNGNWRPAKNLLNVPTKPDFQPTGSQIMGNMEPPLMPFGVWGIFWCAIPLEFKELCKDLCSFVLAILLDYCWTVRTKYLILQFMYKNCKLFSK